MHSYLTILTCCAMLACFETRCFEDESGGPQSQFAPHETTPIEDRPPQALVDHLNTLLVDIPLRPYPPMTDVRCNVLADPMPTVTIALTAGPRTIVSETCDRSAWAHTTDPDARLTMSNAAFTDQVVEMSADWHGIRAATTAPVACDPQEPHNCGRRVPIPYSTAAASIGTRVDLPPAQTAGVADCATAFETVTLVIYGTFAVDWASSPQGGLDALDLTHLRIELTGCTGEDCRLFAGWSGPSNASTAAAP